MFIRSIDVCSYQWATTLCWNVCGGFPHRGQSSPVPARWERRHPARRRWGQPRSCGHWSEHPGSWSHVPVKTPTGRRWADIWSARWTRRGWRWAATGRSTHRSPWRMAPAWALHSWPESTLNMNISVRDLGEAWNISQHTNILNQPTLCVFEV